MVAERVAGFVHDIRNPLGSISLNAELASLTLGDEVDPEIGEALAALDGAVGDLERVLGELGDYLAEVRGDGAREGG